MDPKISSHSDKGTNSSRDQHGGGRGLGGSPPREGAEDGFKCDLGDLYVKREFGVGGVGS